jgi:hypothetical protein
VFVAKPTLMLAFCCASCNLLQVLLLFAVMLGSSPVVDLLGMGAGHIYYFLEDVYPRMSVRLCFTSLFCP